MTDQEPTVQKDGAAYFGREVRYAREHKGMTQQQLADEARYERPYVTKVEGGKLLGSAVFAEVCDRVFDTPGYFARLRDRVSERGHPGWFIPYVTMEESATAIMDYSPVIIMGMLQTREYATAVFRQAHPREDEEAIAARVAARLARLDTMRRPQPPLLWVVLHEAALRTVVGSREVMANQLARLLAEAESPHVVLQVVPFAQGAPAGGLPFVLLAQSEGPMILYTETLQRGHVDDTESVVADTLAKYDRLRAAAMPPEESLAFIREVMEEYAR
ncbi:MAG: helix-turn-helix domain-containing protein [Streptomyces sp.]|nr:helix-turn-helix domain-containing protein [Streptomyces sp.]